jgi:dienelactone hydrolase
LPDIGLRSHILRLRTAAAPARFLLVPRNRFSASNKHNSIPGTRHGFHNNSMPRYDEAAAKLAWDRTIAFFKSNLA